MRKIIFMSMALLLGSLCVGCFSNKDTIIPSRNWSANISLHDFIEFANQMDTFTNVSHEEEFFFDDINSEVKVKETNRRLLISKEYLNADLADLPETLAIQWVTQKNSRNNESFISSLIRWFTRHKGNILFEGKDIHVKKSLIADLKVAMVSESKEITQSLLDANTTSENFSFAFTFYYFDNGYWRSMEKNGDKFNEQRTVKVRDTEGDHLFAFKSDLKAELTDHLNQFQMIQAGIRGVPDRVQAALSLRKNLRLRKRPDQGQTQVNAELLMVPKSIMTTMKAPILRRMQGVKRDNDTWLSLVSIKITL